MLARITTVLYLSKNNADKGEYHERDNAKTNGKNDVWDDET